MSTHNSWGKKFAFVLSHFIFMFFGNFETTSSNEGGGALGP